MSAGTSSAAPVVPVLRHDGNTDLCGTWTGEEEDAAPVLIIGRQAPDAKIQRLAAKHGMDALALKNFARGC